MSKPLGEPPDEVPPPPTTNFQVARPAMDQVYRQQPGSMPTSIPEARYLPRRRSWLRIGVLIGLIVAVAVGAILLLRLV